jgi:hypothetical protein
MGRAWASDYQAQTERRAVRNSLPYETHAFME